MQTVKQFSVNSVNKPGRLAAVLELLRKEKVDLLAMAVMAAGNQHVLRFVPDDPKSAGSALESINMPADSQDVLLVELPSQNGSYEHLCERLAAGHLEMDYSYVSSRRNNGATTAVVKVNNLSKAQRVLSENSSNGAKKKLPRRRPMRSR